MNWGWLLKMGGTFRFFTLHFSCIRGNFYEIY